MNRSQDNSIIDQDCAQAGGANVGSETNVDEPHELPTAAVTADPELAFSADETRTTDVTAAQPEVSEEMEGVQFYDAPEQQTSRSSREITSHTDAVMCDDISETLESRPESSHSDNIVRASSNSNSGESHELSEDAISQTSTACPSPTDIALDSIPPLLYHDSKTCVMLCDAIVRCLQALTGQERSPFEYRHPSSREESFGAQDTPGEDRNDANNEEKTTSDDEDGSDSMSSADSCSSLSSVTDCDDERWPRRREIFSNQSMRLLCWATKFQSSPLTLTTDPSDKTAAHYRFVILSILDLIAMLLDTIIKMADHSRLKECGQVAADKLRDALRKGEEVRDIYRDLWRSIGPSSIISRDALDITLDFALDILAENYREPDNGTPEVEKAQGSFPDGGGTPKIEKAQDSSPDCGGTPNAEESQCSLPTFSDLYHSKVECFIEVMVGIIDALVIDSVAHPCPYAQREKANTSATSSMGSASDVIEPLYDRLRTNLSLTLSLLAGNDTPLSENVIFGRDLARTHNILYSIQQNWASRQCPDFEQLGNEQSNIALADNQPVLHLGSFWETLASTEQREREGAGPIEETAENIPLHIEGAFRRVALQSRIAITYNQSDRPVFQADRVWEALASTERREREGAGPCEVTAEDIILDIIGMFRNVIPNIEYESIFRDLPAALLENIKHVDFTMLSLEHLPQWVVLSNYPGDVQLLTRKTGVTVQAALLDEFWASSIKLVRGLHYKLTSSSDDDKSNSILGQLRCVRRLFFQRLERVQFIQISRALKPTWDIVRQMTNDLVSGEREQTRQQSQVLSTPQDSTVTMQWQVKVGSGCGPSSVPISQPQGVPPAKRRRRASSPKLSPHEEAQTPGRHDPPSINVPCLAQLGSLHLIYDYEMVPQESTWPLRQRCRYPYMRAAVIGDVF